jgi:hypothetical protein
MQEQRFAIPSIIGTQLKFDLVDLNNQDAESEVINFEEVFALLELVKEDPVYVLQTVLKIKTGIDRIYLHYRDHYEDMKSELAHYEAVQTDKFNRKDPSNPLYGEKRLTKDAVEAAVRMQPEWVKRDEELRVIHSYKSQVYLVKTVVSDLFSVTKVLVGYTLNTLNSGEDPTLDTSEISRLAKRISSSSPEDQADLDD